MTMIEVNILAAMPLPILRLADALDVVPASTRKQCPVAGVVASRSRSDAHQGNRTVTS
jgi:hypothetical protein